MRTSLGECQSNTWSIGERDHVRSAEIAVMQRSVLT